MSVGVYGCVIMNNRRKMRELLLLTAFSIVLKGTAYPTQWKGGGDGGGGGAKSDGFTNLAEEGDKMLVRTTTAAATTSDEVIEGEDSEAADASYSDDFPAQEVSPPPGFYEGGQGHMPDPDAADPDCAAVDGDTWSYLCDRPGWRRRVRLREFPDRTERLRLNDTGLDRLPAFSFACKSVLLLEVENHPVFSVDAEAFADLHLTQIVALRYNGWSLETADSLAHSFFHPFRHLANLTQLVLEYNALNLTGVDAAPKSRKTILPRLEYLSLEGNKLSRIEDYLFFPLRSSPLVELNLKSAGLSSIGADAFQHLKGLRHVDFFNNDQLLVLRSDMSFLPGLALALEPLYKESLRSLGLASMGLTTLPYRVFDAVSDDLVRLNLADNAIVNLGNKAASAGRPALPHMPSLRKVLLTSNLIEEVNEETFRNASNLTYLDISGNYLDRVYQGVAVPSLKVLNISSQCWGMEQFLANCPSGFTIPEDVFVDMGNLTVLNMGDVLLQTIREGHFDGLSNLEELRLDNTDLRKIEDGALAPMRKLKRLYLNNNNNLVGLSETTFAGLTELEVLDLAYSSKAFTTVSNSSEDSSDYEVEVKSADVRMAEVLRLDTLKNLNARGTMQDLCASQDSACPSDPSFDFLSGLPNLEYLDISENLLQFWEGDVFSATHNLTALHLEANQIHTCTEGMLESFERLGQLDLSGNPFSCNDWVTSFHQMTLEKEELEVVNYDGGDGYICSYDDDGTKKEVTFRDYAEADLRSHRLKIALGVAAGVMVVAACVTAYVVYRNRFYISYRLHRTRRRLSSIGGGGGGGGGGGVSHSPGGSAADHGSYDVFICYSKEERQWVMEELVPSLEGGDPPVRACVHERDFEVGASVMDNIVQCLDRSRRFLMVLSPGLVQATSIFVFFCFFFNASSHLFLVSGRQ